MIKHIKIYQISLLLSSLGLLASCGTTPTQPETQPKLNTQAPAAEQNQTTSAAEYIERARQADSLEQAVVWYVRSADAYLQQQNPEKAIAILSQLKPELMSDFIQKQYHLFYAESYLAFEQYQNAYLQLENINLIQSFEPRFLAAKSTAASKTGNYLIAARNRIELKKHLLDDTQIQLQNDLIWQDLIYLKPTAYRHFQEPSQVELSGWLELLQITQTYADSPANMLLKIKSWQALFPSHPAAQQLPMGLQLAIKTQPYNPQKIAVILPLSGKFIRQGQAIQQGITASFFEQKLSRAPAITFLDSEAMDWQTFAQTEYDFIIGPLLKSNIEKLSALKLAIPTLYLNDAESGAGNNEITGETQTEEAQVNSTEAESKQNVAVEQQLNQSATGYYSFTLNPEMEARQAALKMLELGHKKPIVFAANNSFGKRMSSAFVDAFKAESDQQINVAFYSNTKEMETSVTRLMETVQSEERIKTIRSLVGRGYKFESDPRNRQDIDAIYIIGDPTQTRILKPYIDVNTSPFAPIIPIYASSLSYSSNLNNADMRDLNQIIFSDMPWILPGRAKQNKLAHQMQLAWGNTNDQLSRLFAFGFDAYQLIPHLAQMQVFPNYQISGMTGELQLNDAQQVERSMRWAKFDHGRVINLALKKSDQ